MPLGIAALLALIFWLTLSQCLSYWQQSVVIKSCIFPSIVLHFCCVLIWNKPCVSIWNDMCVHVLYTNERKGENNYSDTCLQPFHSFCPYSKPLPSNLCLLLFFLFIFYGTWPPTVHGLPRGSLTPKNAYCDSYCHPLIYNFIWAKLKAILNPTNVSYFKSKLPCKIR